MYMPREGHNFSHFGNRINNNVISMYVPHAGHGDITIISTSILLTILIYTPLTGRNLQGRHIQQWLRYFNLCAPCGALNDCTRNRRTTTGISMYTPRVGRTPYHQPLCATSSTMFQFTCPVRGTAATSYSTIAQAVQFQFTCPVRGTAAVAEEPAAVSVLNPKNANLSYESF